MTTQIVYNETVYFFNDEDLDLDGAARLLGEKLREGDGMVEVIREGNVRWLAISAGVPFVLREQ